MTKQQAAESCQHPVLERAAHNAFIIGARVGTSWSGMQGRQIVVPFLRFLLLCIESLGFLLVLALPLLVSPLCSSFWVTAEKDKGGKKEEWKKSSLGQAMGIFCRGKSEPVNSWKQAGERQKFLPLDYAEMDRRA